MLPINVWLPQAADHNIMGILQPTRALGTVQQPIKHGEKTQAELALKSVLQDLFRSTNPIESA